MIKALITVLMIVLSMPAFGMVLRTTTGQSLEGELNYFDSNAIWVVLDANDGHQIRLLRKALKPHDAMVVTAMILNFQKIQSKRDYPIMRQASSKRVMPNLVISDQTKNTRSAVSNPVRKPAPKAKVKSSGKPKRSYTVPAIKNDFFDDPDADLSARKSSRVTPPLLVNALPNGPGVGLAKASDSSFETINVWAFFMDE